MVTKVQKWGNSQGLRLTRQMLEDVGIAVLDACIY
jgi:antitoxin component of MazEF toxin-antitoxin module